MDLDLRAWSIGNVPIELIDRVRSTAYLNGGNIADYVVEAVEDWLDAHNEDTSDGVEEDQS